MLHKRGEDQHLVFSGKDGLGLRDDLIEFGRRSIVTGKGNRGMIGQ
ncbi:hypothetical protein SDC9_191993 [bioreactor metagenome]|uniref:Uncharacterized protein n=1 Tax=bioreactor metagenome TaxID=1076179 RepID=A0A645HZK0_9ZZZZ